MQQAGTSLIRSLFSAAAATALLLPAVSLPALAAAEAEIISVVGKGDKRDTAQADWQAAAARQTVPAGGFVRTRDLSQMALLLPDRTQLRLNQNSQMQIKTIADAAEWKQSAVKLNAGRAWSQARPATAPAGTPAPAARISMETPSATLSIRGTDWEVEVGPDGRTQLVVLSGEVDIANAQGALKVGAGETAAAEIGKAPVRLLLANPAERVQWVTSWQTQPWRWLPRPDEALQPVVALLAAGDFAAAARRLEDMPVSPQRDVLLADLAAMQGDLARAVSLLAPHAAGGAGEPRASALLARVHLARGDGEAAARLLATARNTHPRDAEIGLATAELALFEGDVRAARAALATTLEQEAGNADAWFARGSLETERENIRAARVALDAALAARPAFPRALAERGTLETLAGNFSSARLAYDEALAAAPDDYLALTGRGILKLKTGDARGALDDFLRAGVIEPRFGRAWLYSAAAFYQLGETRRALEALDRAMRLDPRDPLPHVMRGLIAADALDPGGAVDAARAAQERMPFLKSLNQVLNNQKGSANAGSALAAFGMEEWARHYATSAYSPWWAGSHLFLADRQAPGFNKNSELFKGFITDPTVFGAAQRHSSLVPAPGHHGRVDLFLEQADWRQDALVGTANGLTTTPVPLAYFVSADLSAGRSRVTADAADGTNLTLGLGLRPHHALGVFLFGTDTRIDGRLDNATLPGDPLAIEDRRLDLGVNYRHDSSNQIWLKGGSGKQATLVTGSIVLPPTVSLDRYRSGYEQRDFQFRHAFAPAEDVWLSWGYEDARQAKPVSLGLLGGLVTLTEQSDLESRAAWLALRLPLAERLRGELAAFRQLTEFLTEARINGARTGGEEGRLAATHWRGGLQWRFAAQSALTGVHQAWRRPAGVGSLAPIDTLGIPVNDRLTASGGLYRRNRLQVDHEIGGESFLMAFVDRESVENLPRGTLEFPLDQLESLRNRRDAFSFEPEIEAVPQFRSGRVDSLGMAFNHRLDRSHAVAVRYRRSHARQTGANDGLRIPYLPRDMLRLASHWSLPQRWLLGATATWRGARFRDDLNTDPIDAGWGFGFSIYRESADKRWVMQAILDNLRANHASGAERKAKAILRVSYLF